MVPPGSGDHAGIARLAEEVQGKAVVAELALEALVGAVSPSLARIVKRCADPRIGHPLECDAADELWALV